MRYLTVVLVAIYTCASIAGELEEENRQLREKVAALERGLNNVISAPALASKDDVFFKIDSFNVIVNCEDKQLRRRAQTKFELVLRKAGVPIGENSQTDLIVSIATKSGQALTAPSIYSVDINVGEPQVIFHRDEFRRAYVKIWAIGYFGFVPNATDLDETVIKNLVRMAEDLSNKYLAAKVKFP